MKIIKFGTSGTFIIFTGPKCAYILVHVEIVNFPFGTNGKLTIFMCPNIQAVLILEHTYEIKKFQVSK